MWFNQPLRSDTFTAKFDFQLSQQRGIGWGDGFTFAVLDASQNDNHSLGDAGGSLAYKGLSGFAIEFDTYSNYEFNDPVYAHVGLDVAGNMTSTAVSAPLPFDIRDTGTVTAQITYTHGHITVSLAQPGGAMQTVLDTTVPDSVRPQNARVGFTGATAGAVETATVDNFKLETPDKVVLTRGQQFTFKEEDFRPHPYHPTSGSGVTIGVGYDMRERSKAKVIHDLTKAGVSMGVAEKLAAGVGLTGKKAAEFVKANAKLTITQDQGMALFLATYAEKLNIAKGVVASSQVVRQFGPTDWTKLNQRIKDILVDMTFRGDNNLRTRNYFQQFVVANDISGFRKAISNRRIFDSSLPPGRFQDRINYLKQPGGVTEVD